MSKEKQIEEMARIIGHCESTLHPDIECHNKATGCYCIENPCHNQRIAEKLYNAGYRKQIKAEWKSGNKNGQYGYYCTNCDACFTGENAEWIAKEHDYCPKCGAEMKGESK